MKSLIIMLIVGASLVVVASASISSACPYGQGSFLLSSIAGPEYDIMGFYGGSALVRWLKSHGAGAWVCGFGVAIYWGLLLCAKHSK